MPDRDLQQSRSPESSVKRMIVSAVFCAAAVGLAVWGAGRASAPGAEAAPAYTLPSALDDVGMQAVAELHAREDLLLNHYTWANAEHTKVRIPIEQAMQLLAQRGLPVAPEVKQPKPMTGDGRPHVTAPQTNGFARTAYEQGLR